MNDTINDIAQRRMKAQRIGGGAGFADPAAVVEWMGCMQAQDYAMAKWAIGCRMGEGVAGTGEATAGTGEATARTGEGAGRTGEAVATKGEAAAAKEEATDKLVEAHFNAGLKKDRQPSR